LVGKEYIATRTESRRSLEGPLSPDDFRHDYGTYYKTETSDSPSAARSFLGRILLENMYQQFIKQLENGVPLHDISITVLDIGAGRQILERELQDKPLYQKLQPYLRYISGDIADIDSDQLLAPRVAQHVQLNGANLPIASNSVDLAFSCMAIDFMPREAFEETHRVLKDGGTFMAALHHPDLISIALSGATALQKKLRSINQKLKHGTSSRRYPEYLKERETIERQRTNSLFLLQNFPHHIFHGTDEIYEYFASIFDKDAFAISVSEHSNSTRSSTQVIGDQIALPDVKPNPYENGWYFVKVAAR
jgi:SAM-dependent methyltransferase